jgi:hypothetical protein
MSTGFIVDTEPGTNLPPPGGFKQPSIREQLDEPFHTGGEYFVFEGRPYLVFVNWDYAEDWSQYPVREAHPYAPQSQGTKISEAEFRSLVKAMHAIS